MERLWKIARSILLPHIAILIITDLISFPLVGYVLINGIEGNALAILSYILSAYAMTITVLRIVLAAQAAKQNGKLDKAKSLLPDKEVRLFFSLGVSTAVSAIHGIFSIITGITSGYLFGQSSGVYYILLAVLRYTLAGNIMKETKEQQLKAAPWILLSANLVMAVIIVVQIIEGRSTSYPGYLIYAVAFYAFYMCVLSTVNITKARHSDNPAFRMARSLSFSVALITLFSLQLSLIDTFGNDPAFKLRMNIITGIAVILMTISIPVVILMKEKKQLQTIEKTVSTTEG